MNKDRQTLPMTTESTPNTSPLKRMKHEGISSSSSSLKCDDLTRDQTLDEYLESPVKITNKGRARDIKAELR
jgi:hypothetical protein